MRFLDNCFLEKPPPIAALHVDAQSTLKEAQKPEPTSATRMDVEEWWEIMQKWKKKKNQKKTNNQDKEKYLQGLYVQKSAQGLDGQKSSQGLNV